MRIARIAIEMYADQSTTESLVSETDKAPGVLWGVERGWNSCVTARTAKIDENVVEADDINVSEDGTGEESPALARLSISSPNPDVKSGELESPMLLRVSISCSKPRQFEGRESVD
jgi:hypothetical protein